MINSCHTLLGFVITAVILSWVLLSLQFGEPQPDESEEFVLPEAVEPFLSDYPLYTDNTANGMFNAHCQYHFIQCVDNLSSLSEGTVNYVSSLCVHANVILT